MRKTQDRNASGTYFDLQEFWGAATQPEMLKEGIHEENCSYKFTASTQQFEKIPSQPIAYWASNKVQDVFEKGEKLGEISAPRQGLATSNNDRFLRNWHEVPIDRIGFNHPTGRDAQKSQRKWFPYNKGGPFRRWFGNNFFVVNWENDGEELLGFAAELYGSPTRTIKNIKHYFKPSVTWSALTIGSISMRWNEPGFVFDTKGQCIFHDDAGLRRSIIAMTNSKVANHLLTFLAPTLDYNSGTIAKLPFIEPAHAGETVTQLVMLTKLDWDAYETSWGFTTLPLLQPDHRAETLEATYTALRAHWQGMTEEMQQLEEENNRIFIDAYGLQDELTPEVPLKEITLTCNPAYRYGIKNDAEANETRLRADTMAEFLSYAVGCMFGRYSLDTPGLILANQGETLEDYLARIPEPSFMPDKDNVIPVLDANWFPDDITERFRLFLRTTFGETHFRENLKYIEDALGKDIRKYFTKDFYADHVKRYKKRPIYWMFSSPKGTFNALIYMHRYQSDTVSVLLNEYLREFITKLEGERARLDKLADDPSATQGQMAKAIKDTGLVAKQIDELNEWEREVIFPMAQQKIEIDLDDGVKANYPIFGTALKKVTGLS